MINTKVGYMTTSILEQLVKEHIDTFTIKGRYEGEVKYLLVYQQLREYNSKGEDK